MVGEGVGVPAEPVPDGAERVERVGLDRAVAGGDGERRRLRGDLQRAVVLAVIEPDDRENAQRLGLGAPVARLAVQRQRAVQVVVRVVEPAQQLVRLAEVGQVDRLVLARTERPV